MARYSLIGAYRIIPTEKSIAVAADYHGFSWLLNGEGQFSEEIHWDDFENLGLIELEALGSYSPLELLDISQGDQAPYMEFYLDPSGNRQLEETEALHMNVRRVCFFLHFVDISTPLRVGDGLLVAGELASLPDRLAPFTHYVPVD